MKPQIDLGFDCGPTSQEKHYYFYCQFYSGSRDEEPKETNKTYLYKAANKHEYDKIEDNPMFWYNLTSLSNGYKYTNPVKIIKKVTLDHEMNKKNLPADMVAREIIVVVKIQPELTKAAKKLQEERKKSWDEIISASPNSDIRVPNNDIAHVTTNSLESNTLSAPLYTTNISPEFNGRCDIILDGNVKIKQADGTLQTFEAWGQTAVEATESFNELSKALANAMELVSDSSAKTKTTKKEKTTMTKLFGDVKIGKYTGTQLKVSMKGLAIRTAEQEYHAYDHDTKDITDVSDFTMDMDMLYLMPVGFKDIKVGDVIQHKQRFVIVIELMGNDRLKVVDVYDGSEKTVIPTKNIFNFNFYTKVMNPMEGMFGKADASNPFGNMIPFLMMSESKGDQSPMEMMMLMQMMNGGQTSAMDMSNPMMMMALMGEGSDMKSMLPMMMMMQSQAKDGVTEIPNA